MIFYADRPDIIYQVHTSENVNDICSGDGVTLSDKDADGFSAASVPVDVQSRFLMLTVEAQ
jgi:hypothetical protein